MKKVKIEYVKNLHPVFTKRKRIKIIVGGRGSTKSTGVADYVAVDVFNGGLWCCARENQNSIEESVHRTILDEISRLELEGFEDTKTSITHTSGGRTFYRGLARNITSLKSTLSGIDGLWIEEGEDISANTLRVLTASVRLNAKDSQRLIDGEDVKMPEIVITMNRGLRSGAVAQKWLKRAEKDLARCGYYEDDEIMVVEMNYTDMPKAWFDASGLETERKSDEERLTAAAYSHKWLGGYLDEVEDAIIPMEWFNASVDAHKKLGFKPQGVKIVSHDPSDGGDNKGIAERHGSVFTHIIEQRVSDVNDGFDEACEFTLNGMAEYFTWDSDGLGLPLRKQANDQLAVKGVNVVAFHGGSTVEDPKGKFEDISIEGESKRPRNNKEALKNLRSQYAFRLMIRFYKTWRAVTKGEYIDPDEMISIDSDGCDVDLVRAEVCSVPRKRNPNGVFQLVSKSDMKKPPYNLPSPGLFDCMMMTMLIPDTIRDNEDSIEFEGW
jgi:phage terminase large subunit